MKTRRNRKQKGGAPPSFQSAVPSNLDKLSKEDARDFILQVCKKDLPNYLSLIKKQRGCVNNVCPTKPTPAQRQWQDVEKDFTGQCATAERLKMVKSIPSSANLAASYVKTTANRLIANSKANTSKSGVNATAKAAANATAKAAANATAKAAANAKAKANANAKAAANAKAKANANATAKAKANANARARANATAKARPQTEVEKYLAKPSSSSTPVVSVTTASTPAASAYLSGTKTSSLQQNIQKITQNLQSAKLVLANMTKKGGATRRRRV